MTAGAWVLLATIAAALAFGVYRAYADGRFRGTHSVRGADPDGRGETDARPGSDAEPEARLLEAVGHALGARATLVQFSSAFCAPCRATRRVLSDVAQTVPGVVHHEVDAERHLELVRHLNVLRTPTTLVLDERGVEVARASGAPTRAQVVAQLGALI